MKLLNSILFSTVILAGFTACSSEEIITSAEDRSGLVLAAQLYAPQTRSTYNGQFNDNDVVRVKINNNEMDFKADAAGNLTPATALYWNNYDANGIDALAWYPATYKYNSLQNDNDKLQASDFIFAETVTGIKRNNYSDLDKKLIFKHKTAKVGITLNAGTDIKADDLSKATVLFYGYTNVTGIDYASKGEISGDSKGWITPFQKNFDFVALMIPIEHQNLNIFKITLNNVDYYYKGSAKFEAEKYYHFDITVNKTGLTLESTISDWTSGGDDSGDAEMQ